MKKFTLALIVTILAFTFSSCRKEKDTTATVLIVDSNNSPRAGVYVRVFCPDATCSGGSLNANINRNSVTGADGKVTFDYTEDFQLGQAGFAVLDVAVYLTESDMDAYTNTQTTGVIKIEEEIANEQTIICQSCP